MTRRQRLGLFALGASGLCFLLVWGVLGLPAFGHYAGAYGEIVVRSVEPQRHIANAVTAVVFDYRGFDTMGEELILFATASAVAMLLRETRAHDTEDIVDRVRSDTINGAGVLATVATFLIGLDVVAHGFVTPGGGFQGGVVLAAAVVLVFFAVEYHAYARLAPTSYGEPLESFGAGAFVALGMISFGFGLAFLANFIGFGVTGRIRSGGSAALVNWASALAVAGGFLVIFSEYLEENMAARYGRKRVR
jgi:multicomponent Na+:H+ antiporter subunit B